MESATAQGVDVLDAVGALRWSRPDLAASLAEHLMECAEAVSDRDAWLVAAGRRVQATAAGGDARDLAAHVLESLPRWGRGALVAQAAAGLRLELAVLSHDAGEVSVARALLDGVAGEATEAGLVADVATARLRCTGDGLVDPADALAAWERVGGTAGEIGSAATLLITAAADRRRDRPADGVARAVEGLERLDRARPSPRASSPSPYLAAALAAEWIASLIAAGRSDQASEGSRPLRERLADHTRPTRQLALLRLTLTRVAAAEGQEPRDVVHELERAAHEAASSDTPQLEMICRSALGEVHEVSGRADAARESMRLATVAERRHRARTDRFRTALAFLPGAAAEAAPPPGSPTTQPRPGAGDGKRSVDGVSVDAGATERTARLRAVQTASMRATPAIDGRPPDPTPAGAGRRRRREGEPGTNGSRRNGAPPAGPREIPGRSRGSGTAGGRDLAAGGRAAGPDPWATGLWSGGSPDDGGARAAGAGPVPRPGAGSDGSADGARGRVEPGRIDGEGRAGSSDHPGSRGPDGHGAADRGVGPGPAGARDTAEREQDPAPGTEKAGMGGGAGIAAAASALADPEAWLASALADLDRIWGRPADEPDATGPDSDEPGATGPHPDDADASRPASAEPGPDVVVECVVVIDLARAGARVPADESAPTVRRVGRRLAQRLPATGRLRRDSPDAVSVVLADGDRVAAAEWMRRVVPALVEGLAVDAAVQGALLRAAVHDEHGVVGAQVLRRLDGSRGREDETGTPRPARHTADRDPDPAPGAARPDRYAVPAEDAGRGGEPVPPPAAGVRHGNGVPDGWALPGVAGDRNLIGEWEVTGEADRNGGPDNGVRGHHGELHRNGVRDRHDGPDHNGGPDRNLVRDRHGEPDRNDEWDRNGVRDRDGGPNRDGERGGNDGRDGEPDRDEVGGRDGEWGRNGSGRDGARETLAEPGGEHLGSAPWAPAPDRDGRATNPDPDPDPDRARTQVGEAGEQRHHDETGGRQPYLPDGVIVRPGTGGRRHRRDDAPARAAVSDELETGRANPGHTVTGHTATGDAVPDHAANADMTGTDHAATRHAATDRERPDLAAPDRAATHRAATDRERSDPAATSPASTVPATADAAGSAPARDPGPAPGSGPATATPEPGAGRPSPVRRAAAEEDGAGPTSTEGLGLADLLAGALAAYRGI